MFLLRLVSMFVEIVSKREIVYVSSFHNLFSLIQLVGKSCIKKSGGVPKNSLNLSRITDDRMTPSV